MNAQAAATRKHKARNAQRRHDIVAALSQTDVQGEVSLVIARRGPSTPSTPGTPASGPSSGTGEVLRLLFAGSFAQTDGASIRRELLAQKATLLVRVVPTRRSVARVVRVPVATDADLSRTLALIVEAETPPNVLPHRAGAAYLPLTSSTNAPGQTRCVLITGWADTRDSTDARGPLPALGALEGIDERWATPLGALAALRAVTREPDAPIIDARVHEGALSVLAAKGDLAAARVVVDEPDDEHDWEGVVERSLREACELGGFGGSDGSASDDEVSSMRARAFPGSHDASASLAGRINTGVTGSLAGTKLRTHALTLGACVAAVDDGQQLGLAGLASLREHAPKVDEPTLARITRWASAPARAGALVGVALLAMLLVPWGIAWGRLSIAHAKAKDLADVRGKSREVEVRAAMYDQLGNSRWPMTKLLSDIAGASPVGVSIEEVRLTVEQNISLEGFADSRELVTTLEANLNASKLFSKVTPKSVGPKDSGVEFNYTLEVASGTAPHTPVKPIEDFVAQPLAVRLHGEGATNTLPPKGASQQQAARRASAAPSGAAMPAQASASGGSGSTASESRRPSNTTSSTEPPPEIKDEDIAKLNASDAMKGWAERRRYLSANAKADPAVRTRVEEEATKLQARMREAREAESKKADAPNGDAAKDGGK